MIQPVFKLNTQIFKQMVISQSTTLCKMQTLTQEQVLLEPAIAQMPVDSALLLSLLHHQRQTTK
jgi:hypothetical protein